MAKVTCGQTAEDWDQLWNPTLISSIGLPLPLPTESWLLNDNYTNFFVHLECDSVSSLRWFEHVERKDDNDWVKHCITWEVEGIRQRTPKKRRGGIVLRMTWKF